MILTDVEFCKDEEHFGFWAEPYCFWTFPWQQNERYCSQCKEIITDAYIIKSQSQENQQKDKAIHFQCIKDKELVAFIKRIMIVHKMEK